MARDVPVRMNTLSYKIEVAPLFWHSTTRQKKVAKSKVDSGKIFEVTSRLRASLSRVF